MEQLRSVGIQATLKPGPVSEDTSKKADIRAFFPNYQVRHIDVAIVSPNAQTYAADASHTPLSAAISKYKQKMDKHRPQGSHA